MIHIKEFIKKPLYRVSDGKKLGDIKDIYVDGNVTQIQAVYLGKEGLIKRTPLAIPLTRIAVAGIDCWLVAEATEPVDAREMDGGEGMTLVSEFKGRELQTAGGTRIGVVGDLVVDEEFYVVAFALSKVNVEGPIAENKTVPRHAVGELGDAKTPAVVDLEAAEQG